MKGSQYLEIFREETAWHFQNLDDCMKILEKEPGSRSAVSELFRAVHSLTGMAGTMGFVHMQHFSGEVEAVLLEIQRSGGHLTGKTIDLLLECRNVLKQYLENIRKTSREGMDGNDALLVELKESAKRKESGKEQECESERTSAPVKNDTGKFSGVRFFREEAEAFESARKDGCRIYGFEIMLYPDCLLKTARAALVFWKVKDFGEILCSRPGFQKIKEGKFGHTFIFFLASKESLGRMLAALGKISEIDVAAEEIKHQPSFRQTSEKKKEEHHQKAPKQKEPDRKVSRTVCVEMDKLDDLMDQAVRLILVKNSLTALGLKNQALWEKVEDLEYTVEDLYASIVRIRMIPMEFIVGQFPDRIREFSRKTGKNTELLINGADTE